LAGNYVHYEILLFFFAVALRLIWIRTQDRLWKLAQILDRIVQIMVVVSVFSTIILRQVDSCILANIICFFVLESLVLNMEYRWRTRCPSPPIIENKDIFRPVEIYNDLLPQQQTIANEIISMICDNCAESSASICVSGEWGVGKTSIVNGAIDQLKKKARKDGKVRHDECIYINAMELDTLSSLFDYFFSRMRDILKKRGAYVGLGSEYQKFISASLGKITDSSIAALLESRLFPSSDDYRERLKALEESIYTTLNRDMILVIVDDVERCEKNKARSFIAFIKEIATMRGIVTIFITDFKYLSSNTKDAEQDSGFYYDKFFNYHINVPPISTEEFMQKKDAGSSQERLRSLFSLRPVREIFLSIQENLNDRDQRRKEQQPQRQNGSNTESGPETDRINQPGYLFSNALGLPRTLSKFYRSFNQVLQVLSEHYLHDDKLSDDAKKFFKDIHLDKVLFFLAFIQVCTPNECSGIMDQGLEYFGKKDTEVSAHHRLVIALGEGLLYHYSPLMGVMSQSYPQSKAWQFTQMCLQGKLPDNIKSFDSKEEEWFAEIENDNVQLMNEVWPDMVSAVARILTWKDPVRGKRCLEKLFSFAHQKLIDGEWKIDLVFRIFDHQWRNEGTFSQGIPVLELFWTQFSDTLSSATQAEAKLLKDFITPYLWQRSEAIVPAICLFVPADKDWEATYKTLNSKFESLLLGDESENKKMNVLLDQISPSLVNLELPPMDDAYTRLDILAGKAEKFLVKNCLNGLDDMENIIKRLRMAVDELRFLEKIKQKIMDSGGLNRLKPDSFIQNADLNEMDNIIEYFQLMVQSEEPLEREQLSNHLRIFFDRLRSSKHPLSGEQYQLLQEILTRVAELNGQVPLLYRMILVECWNRCQNDEATPVTDESSQQ